MKNIIIFQDKFPYGIQVSQTSVSQAMSTATSISLESLAPQASRSHPLAITTFWSSALRASIPCSLSTFSSTNSSAATLFSKVYLAEENVSQTADTTPFVLFEFLRLLIIWRFIEDVTRGLNGVFVYILNANTSR